VEDVNNDIVEENNTPSEGPAVVRLGPPGGVARLTAERPAERSGECAAAGRSGEGG